MAKKLEEIKEEECLYELPEGWKWERLGNVTEVASGGTPSSKVKEYYNGDIAWITPADLSGYKKIYISCGAKNITKIGLDKSSAKLLPKDTVLLSSRAPIGYVVIARNELSTNQGFKNFLPSDDYLPKYLYWYLKGNKDLLESYASGTTFLELSASKAKMIEFPLAPKETQQKIIGIIESLFAKLDVAQEKVEQVLAESENRRSAILHNAFSGKLTEKWRKENGVSFDSWKNVKISDIFSLKAGKTISAKNISDTYDDINKYECYGGNGIRGYVESFNREGEHPIIGRQGALCGNIHLATGKFYATEHAVVVDYLYDTDTMWAVENLRFLNLNQYSASVAQPGLAVKKIMDIPITFPLYEEQREIGKLLSKLLSVEDKVKSTCQSTLETIATMRKSILAKAFRGELCS